MAVAVEPDAPAQVLESALESVVVYARGAVCTRRARFTLPADHRGELRVRIGGIPLSAYARSLRGTVATGPDALRVADVRPHLEAAIRAPGDLPELRQAVRAADEHAARVRGRRDRVRADVDAVAALRAVPAKPRRDDPYPRPAAVEPVLALADFVADRLTVLHTRLRALDADVDQAMHDLQVAQHRLSEASGALRTEEIPVTGAAVLTLDLPEAAADGGVEAGVAVEVVLDVEYQVPGARWVPQYQLRLDRAMASGSLVMRAAVAQRTGEDWTGVRLGLSTADLNRRTDLPELRSLRIGRRQDAPAPSGWREPPTGLAELFTDYDTYEAKRRERAAQQLAARAVAGPSGATTSMTLAGGFAPVPGSAPDWMALEQRRDIADTRLPPMQASAPMPPPMAAPIAAPMPAAPGSAAPQPSPRPAGRSARARKGNASRAADFDDDYAGAAPPAAEMAYGGAAFGIAADAAPVAKAAAPDGPGAPDDHLLDYANLVLAGPDDAMRRGRLGAAGGTNPIAQYHRSQAESVDYIALPAHAARVRESAGSYDYRFDVAAPADVEADGGWHTVPVCAVEVGLEPEFVCVPSVDDAVYGTVHVTNASAHALLAGPADVIVAGEFLMTVPLPTLAPGERRQVGVGVVESVQVARRTHMRESTAGLRNQTTVLDHRVEIEIANHLSHEIGIEVRERVPVSDDKDVKIEEHPADPGWEKDEEPRDGHLVRGARVWRLRLPAGATRTLVGRYEIRIPGGKAVVGGNRRA